jgi:hypothetical protein
MSWFTTYELAKTLYEERLREAEQARRFVGGLRVVSLPIILRTVLTFLFWAVW